MNNALYGAIYLFWQSMRKKTVECFNDFNSEAGKIKAINLLSSGFVENEALLLCN